MEQANLPQQKHSSDLPLILTAIFGTVVLFLATLAVLNYLNILSLSKMFPEVLGWLPRQKTAGTELACLKTSPLFIGQTATINGFVTRVKDNTLTMRDDQGQTDSFEAAPNVQIYTFRSLTKPPNTSTGLSAIKLDQKATITLQADGGVYKIVSISYVPVASNP